MSNQTEPEIAITSGMIDTWKCPACGHINEFRHSCLKCGLRRQNGSGRSPVEDEPASQYSLPAEPTEAEVVLQSVALSESTQDQTWLYLDKLINGPIPVSVAISAILFIVYTLFRLMFGTADPNMGIFILGIGIVFVSSGTYVLWRAHRRRNWPATFCEVTRRSRTSMSISSGSSKDGWTLNYRYKVSGEEYTGSWFCKKWNPAKPFANQVPEDPVVVFYNPRNPEQSVVDRRAGASQARAEMLMGLALFVVGLIVWLS